MFTPGHEESLEVGDLKSVSLLPVVARQDDLGQQSDVLESCGAENDRKQKY